MKKNKSDDVKTMSGKENMKQMGIISDDKTIKETYKIQVRCKNCGYPNPMTGSIWEIEIPKGTTWDDFVKEKECIGGWGRQKKKER